MTGDEATPDDAKNQMKREGRRKHVLAYYHDRDNMLAHFHLM